MLLIGLARKVGMFDLLEGGCRWVGYWVLLEQHGVDVG